MSDNQIPWTPTDDEFDELWSKYDNDTQQLENVPDILSTMFEQQRKHMLAYDDLQNTHTRTAHGYGLEDRKVQANVREFAGYHIEELYEAINHLKNKPWKQTDKMVNRDEFLEELADAWHFFIEMHIIAGVSPVEVFTAYFAKTLVNNERRASGY